VSQSRLKRVFDVVAAVLALGLSWPLIAVGALLVVLSSRGPAFYRARRAGLRGRPFDVLKLRTMRVGTDTPDRRITDARDDRVTPVGRFLRRSKIDELPQFWNVLVGEMSVVGPRPEAVDIVERYYTPEQRRTLEMRPGLASPADVRWYPDLTYHDPPPPGVPIQEHYLARHMPAQLEEALRYVDEQSFWLDLRVVAQTAACVLFRSWVPPKRRPLPEASGVVAEERTQGATG
jgi:lipopolysaccharide/colanic/teichoic acid biosynthesis glycosyltransferase